MSKRIVILTTIGVAVGALAGYIYYATVGCSSGGCAITSSPCEQHLIWKCNGRSIVQYVRQEKKCKRRKEVILIYFSTSK
jgi:hypothetical protein